VACARELYTRRRFLRDGGTSLLATLCAPAAVVGRQTNDQLGVRAGEAPTLVQGSDGRTHVAYELHVTWDGADQRLERVRVFDGGDLLLTYGPDELEARMMRPELPRDSRYGRLIGREAAAVLSIWFTVPDGVRPPRSLRHELYGATGTAPIGEMDVTIQKPEPLVLGPPFRQGLWLAHNGPGAHRAAHWGSMLVHGRRITVPQRYAIDFLGLDGNGRGTRRALTGSSNGDWFGFGADVVAAVDSLVLEARDGIADNPPLFEPPPPRTVELSDAGGNYVVLDLGRRRFIHYAHLQQGSVTVRAGQRVRRGQVLARLGNSGNTNGAHLHFNVVNRRWVKEAEGLPYVFDALVVRGTTTTDSAFGDAAPVSPDKSQRLLRALPLDGSIVEFRPG
jgi:hypothetical protein